MGRIFKLKFKKKIQTKTNKTPLLRRKNYARFSSTFLIRMVCDRIKINPEVTVRWLHVTMWLKVNK